MGGKKTKKIVGLLEVLTSISDAAQWRETERGCEMAEDQSDVVASLLSFSRRAFTEKLQIIKNGRPTPKLELKEEVNKVERYFKTENYQRYPWMSGLKKTNRLYCWSCLLFTNDKSSTSVSRGFVSFTNLTKSAHRHQDSAPHL